MRALHFVLVCALTGTVGGLVLDPGKPSEPLTPPLPPAEPVVPPLPPVEAPVPLAAPQPKRYLYGPVVYVVPMRVTACSPQDPKDAAYYAKNGYAGDAYGIAAYNKLYPKGTQMRIPGYMRTTWEDVDSSGGSVIRRSQSKGCEHVDVKFRTLHSVKTWGSQFLSVEVILPSDATAAQRHHITTVATDSYPAWVKEVQ